MSYEQLYIEQFISEGHLSKITNYMPLVIVVSRRFIILITPFQTIYIYGFKYCKLLLVVILIDVCTDFRLLENQGICIVSCCCMVKSL